MNLLVNILQVDQPTSFQASTTYFVVAFPLFNFNLGRSAYSANTTLSMRAQYGRLSREDCCAGASIVSWYALCENDRYST